MLQTESATPPMEYTVTEKTRIWIPGDERAWIFNLTHLLEEENFLFEEEGFLRFLIRPIEADPCSKDCPLRFFRLPTMGHEIVSSRRVEVRYVDETGQQRFIKLKVSRPNKKCERYISEIHVM